VILLCDQVPENLVDHGLIDNEGDDPLWFAKNSIQVFEPLIRAHDLNGNRAP
jgi:hypothetical protein